MRYAKFQPPPLPQRIMAFLFPSERIQKPSFTDGNNRGNGRRRCCRVGAAQTVVFFGAAGVFSHSAPTSVEFLCKLCHFVTFSTVRNARLSPFWKKLLYRRNCFRKMHEIKRFFHKWLNRFQPKRRYCRHRRIQGDWKYTSTWILSLVPTLLERDLPSKQAVQFLHIPTT